MKIQNNQKALKFEIIFETDSDVLSSQSLIENLKSLFILRDLFMSDQSVRKVLTLRKKKLFKKIKACALEASEKFLILLMSQKIENIIMKNIFNILFLIHQIIFQNLSQEIKKKTNDEIHMSFRIIISRCKKKLLNDL